MKPRVFAVDYQDNNGNDYNAETCLVGDISDVCIIAGTINDYRSRGYTVTAIHEMLDGYNKDELEQMANDNPHEAVKHIRLLYLADIGA